MAQQTTSKHPLPYSDDAHGFDAMVADRAAKLGADADTWKTAVMRVLKRGWYNVQEGKLQSDKRAVRKEELERKEQELEQLNRKLQDPEIQKLLAQRSKAQSK
jgi:hypothetical protein